MIFQLPINVTPNASLVTLGDTLWLSGSFPDTLLEYYSNKYFKLPNFDFKAKLCLRRLENNQSYISDQPEAFSHFDIANKIGNLTQTSSICGPFHFEYHNNQYHYKIGLIGKQVGIYTLNFFWPIDLHGMPDEQID